METVKQINSGLQQAMKQGKITEKIYNPAIPKGLAEVH